MYNQVQNDIIIQSRKIGNSIIVTLPNCLKQYHEKVARLKLYNWKTPTLQIALSEKHYIIGSDETRKNIT